MPCDGSKLFLKLTLYGIIVMTKNHSLTFYIELSSKSIGMGFNLALLKDNWNGLYIYIYNLL